MVSKNKRSGSKLRYGICTTSSLLGICCDALWLACDHVSFPNEHSVRITSKIPTALLTLRALVVVDSTEGSEDAPSSSAMCAQAIFIPSVASRLRFAGHRFHRLAHDLRIFRYEQYGLVPTLNVRASYRLLCHRKRSKLNAQSSNLDTTPPHPHIEH